jgi:hypothetical protein
MVSVVVDIDDTLISTIRRMQSIWHHILKREISMEAVETMGLEQIFTTFASPEQKKRATEFQRRFWDVVLCLEKVGVDLLMLDEPIPFAADVLQRWSKQCTIVYLTGRTENTRQLTLHELKSFGFPIDRTQLVMFNLEDYSRVRGENPSGPTLVDGKSKFFSLISKEHNVVRVVDDIPSYFQVYKQFAVRDRIGLLRSKLYSSQQYIDKGATRVVESWKQLQDDPPKPT